MPHYHYPYDWQREQVFPGYDPAVDGFGYPVELPPAADARCFCTQDPAKPEQATLCDTCIERLRCGYPSVEG